MRLAIFAEDLKNALFKTLSVVDKRNPRPILTYCKFLAEDEKVTIEATDLEVSEKISIPSEIQESGSFCVNPKNLFDVIKEMPNKNILMSYDLNSNLLRITCDQIDISLLTTSIEEYPQLIFSDSNEFKIEADELLRLINKTSFAMSHDETRIFLNGIYFQETDGNLRAVATNGYTLSLLETQNFTSSSEVLKEGVIIPKKGINELKKLCEQNSGKELNLFLDESFLFASIDNVEFISVRLIARDYPPYQNFIPAKTTYSMTVSRDNLITSIRRVKVLANEKSNAVKLSLGSEALTISANHPTLGEAVEKIEVDYNGKAMDIGFNARYLLESLNVFDSDEVSFHFNNELSAFVLKSHSDQDFLGMIMPLKI